MNFNFITKILSLKIFKDKLMSHIMESFNLNFNQINKTFGYTTKTNPKAIEALKLREIILCDKSMAALQGDLKFSLLQGIEAHESIDQIKRRLDKIFNTSQVNTERIARTEVLYAQEEGVFQSHKSSGVAQWKVWHANMGNSRTSEDSKKLNGQVQKIDKPFKCIVTGNEIQHSPSRPNCRCYISYHTEKPKTKRKNGIEYIK